MTANSPKTDKPWQFKKGKSGNPSGRPKTASVFKELIQAHAFKRAEHNKTHLQHLIERMYHEDHKTYLAYAFGKPIETHEVKIEQEIAGVPQEVVEGLRQRFLLTFTGNNSNGHG